MRQALRDRCCCTLLGNWCLGLARRGVGHDSIGGSSPALNRFRLRSLSQCSLAALSESFARAAFGFFVFLRCTTGCVPAALGPDASAAPAPSPSLHGLNVSSVVVFLIVVFALALIGFIGSVIVRATIAPSTQPILVVVVLLPFTLPTSV